MAETTSTSRPPTARRLYRVPPSFPKTPRDKRPHISFITPLLSLLAIIALLHFIAVVHVSNTIAAPVTNCDTLLRTTNYTKFVQMSPGQQNIGAIQQVNQLLNGQPAVLVPVVGTDTQHSLSVYIYGCTIEHHTPTLTLLFKQQGLAQGTFSISQAHTLILSSVDPTLAAQDTMLMQATQANIYQEYAWQQGKFVQVAFPSLYPVLSRGEAETLQQQEDSGQQLPWTDPLFTAEQMAKDILQSSGSSSNTDDRVLDNNGTIAHVQLVLQQPATTLTVTLQRLIQPNDSGLWFVTAAQTSDITLAISTVQHSTAPFISSPITLTGTSSVTGGTINISLFDHTLTPMSALLASNLSLRANGSYAGQIAYTNNQPSQPGLLLVSITPSKGSMQAAQMILQNVIIS